MAREMVEAHKVLAKKGAVATKEDIEKQVARDRAARQAVSMTWEEAGQKPPKGTDKRTQMVRPLVESALNPADDPTRGRRPEERAVADPPPWRTVEELKAWSPSTRRRVQPRLAVRGCRDSGLGKASKA